MKRRLLWASALAAVTASCGLQTELFKPVAPAAPIAPKEAFAPFIQSKSVIARQPKPNLMVLLDRSASMNLPMNPAAAGCPAGCGLGGQACPPTCPTRLSEVVAGLNAFLEQNGTFARLGLAVFPTSAGECAATRQEAILVKPSSSNDVDAQLQATADDVRAALARVTAGGDDPTAGSLSFLTTYSPLLDPDRQNFVLLLTDSPPGCGDQGSASAAVTELNKKNIKTIVIAFGPDTRSSAGSASLDAMAQAGGFSRICPRGTDAECGTANSCDTATGTCRRKFYQLSNGAELTLTLLDLARPPIYGDPCVCTLDVAPVLPPQLRVLVDGQLVPSDGPGGGWSYSGRGVVTFTGSLCARLGNATPQQPARVEFQILKSQ